MSKVLLLPIAAYFGYTGYILFTEPTLFNKQFDKAIQSLPSFVSKTAETLLTKPENVKYLGGFAVFLSLLVLTQIRPLLRLASIAFLVAIATVVAGIVERKLEMQQLSEALERIAYLLVVTGMLFVAGSFEKVSKAEKDNLVQLKQKKASVSDEKSGEKKPEAKQEQKQEQKQDKKSQKKKD